MKILLSSHSFAPNIGGIETVSELLALEFCRAGHEVRVVTQTVPTDSAAWPFQVVRRPSAWELYRQLRWCEVYFQNNISLRTAWPFFFVHRPWIIAHQTWLAGAADRVGIAYRVKSFVVHFARNISISRAVASSLDVPSVVISNPYRDSVFCPMNEGPRDRELLFLGRLVSDKGADLLINALADLREAGVEPMLTVVGSGPEEAALRALVEKHALVEQVSFIGSKQGGDLATILRAHQVLVVPSRWAEPFGLVALEGIACGCVVVGSEGGGLKEAIGPCGLTFRNGSVASLTGALRTVLARPELIAGFRSQAEEHLHGFTPATSARQYLQVFEEALRGS